MLAVAHPLARLHLALAALHRRLWRGDHGIVCGGGVILEVVLHEVGAEGCRAVHGLRGGGGGLRSARQTRRLVPDLQLASRVTVVFRHHPPSATFNTDAPVGASF